jgi:uncharacterized repeat protein (TIGR01451 family)
MRIHLSTAAVVAVLLCASAAASRAQTCVGDCNGDRAVTINELITGVNIALGSATVESCRAVDRNSDGGVSIDELIAAVSNALNGCPAAPATATATPSSTATASETATRTASASFTPTVTATPTVTVTSTATASLTPTPTTRPPVLAVQVNPDRIAPGETAVIGLTVTNDGVAPLNGVTLRAVLPASGIAGVDRGSISDGGSCNGFSCAAGQQVTWTIGTLAPGAGRSVNLPLTVITGQNAPADLTELNIAASATAIGAAATNAQATIVVDRGRNLTLAIDADRDPVAPDAELRYRFTVGNRGVTALTDATLSIPIPPGTSFVSASDGAMPDGGLIEWPLGDLAAGASGVRELVVHVDAVAGQAIAADASLTAGGGTTQAQHLARVGAAPPLSASLAAGPDPIGPGEALLVSFTLTNRGLTPLAGVQAALRVPAGVAGIETAAASDAVCNQGVSFGCDPLERARWTVGDLAPGEGVTYSLPATVLTGQGAPAPGTLLGIEADAFASDGTEAEARRSVAIRANRALEVELDATPQPISANGLLRYVISFGNRGVTPLASGHLTIPIPAGTVFESATEGITPVGGAVSWPLGDLAAGSGGVRELFVRVEGDAAAGAPIHAAATLTAGGARAAAESVTHVAATAPLTLSLSVGPDPITPGEAFQVALTVTNRGLVELFELQGALRVPAEVSAFATNLTTGGVVCNNGASFGCDPLERALWNIGSLPPGRSTTLTFPVGVPTGQGAAPAGAIISFDAEVKSNTDERAQTRRSVLLRPSRAAELEIDSLPQTVAAGAEIRHRLSFGNRGLATLTGAMLELPLPAGTSFESASDGGMLEDGVVRWELGDLTAGITGTRTVDLLVDELPQGAPIAAEAVLRSGAAETRADALVTVRDDLPLSVDVITSPAVVQPGEPMSVRVLVSNHGLLSLFDVRAGLRVPPEVAAWPTNISSPGSTCNAAASFGCDALERQVWTIGELKPGQGVALSVPPIVLSGQNAPPAGSLISFAADATANDGSQALAQREVSLRTSYLLDLRVSTTTDPIAPGELLAYSIRALNLSGGPVNDVVLEMPVPAGTQFHSANNGGVLEGDRIVWTLPNLTSSVTLFFAQVMVDAAAQPGSTVRAEAFLFTDTGDTETFTVTRIENHPPLALSVSATPDPAAPGQSVLLSVTATNNSPVNLFGITASVRVPSEVSSFAANLTGGGNCNRGATFGCDPLETVLWSLGTPEGLPPGESVTVSIPPVVPMGVNAPPPGTAIDFEIDVRANDGSQAVAYPVVSVE